MDTQAISRDQMYEMSIAILQATNDGDKLSPSDLKLVELAVNEMLNPDGLERFRQLHQNATKPEGYTAPFLFDIEHLTIDHDRWVRWKGIAVDHFDHGVWQRPGWRQRMRNDAEAVAAACRQLEAEGVEPSVSSVLARQESTPEAAVAESEPGRQQPPAPEIEQVEKAPPSVTALPLKTLYWGENDSHEFWESEDRQLLILRPYGETWWSVLRCQRFQFPIQTAEAAATRLNVALCPDRVWKRGASGTFALQDREVD